MRSISTVCFLLCSFALLATALAQEAEVDRIYHINEKRWGSFSEAEIGCAVADSPDFVTFSFGPLNRPVEIVYWKHLFRQVAPNNPPGFAVLKKRLSGETTLLQVSWI